MLFNPFRPAYQDDPYPFLRHLQQTEPVLWSPDLDVWVVTRYADCLRVLQDDESFSSDPVHARGDFGRDIARKRAEVPLGSAPLLGNTDPPGHQRLRTLVNRGFTPRVIDRAQAAIEDTCDQLLDDWDTPRCDLIRRFAEPLAISTVLGHLGIPREGWGNFREWSLAIMRARSEGVADPAVFTAADTAAREMLDYLAGLAESLEPAADAPLSVLQVLLEACDEGTLAPEEMVMLLIHISLAGNGPTAMALGNAAWALSQQPDAQDYLRANPERLPAAVEEFFRFDSPTHFIARFAKQDVVVGTRTIRTGQQLHVMVGAANRDPERFPDPDLLDFSREDNRHLSFGYGIHFCLGAPLARLELRTGLLKLLQSGPFRYVESERGGSYQVRGLARLVVERVN